MSFNFRSPLFFVVISFGLHLTVFFILNSKFRLQTKEDTVEIQLLEVSHEAAPPENAATTLSEGPSNFEKVSHQSNEPDTKSPPAIVQKNATSSPTSARPPEVTAPPVKSGGDLARTKPTYDTLALGIQVSYPRLSRVFEEQGQVILNILKSPSNQIEKIAIEKSSGFSRLDEAALEAAKHHDFSNIKIDGEFKISFVFKLK
ncbi:MAG: energy transducer TonB [Pseudobdellovibrio sp.]